MKCVVTESGIVRHMEVEEPVLQDLFVLVETEYSAISIGTERGLIHNPAITKPHQLGYSAAGRVIAVGRGVTELQVGDAVACYGGPYVYHGERLAVPQNLCVKIPEGVSMKEAAFVGLGAIAIHGARRLNLQFGESVVVMGLGLLGQFISQLCHQANYVVVATDMQESRCEQAKQLGVPHVVNIGKDGVDAVRERVNQISNGYGADGVVITAHSSTPIIDQALEWTAPRGKVVVVGNVPMDFTRELFFQKEADVVISRAAGPGRYDSVYERDGIDYPRAYVRWTEGRNLGEYIRQVRDRRLSVAPLISHEFDFADAPNAYRQIEEIPGVMAAVFKYTH